MTLFEEKWKSSYQDLKRITTKNGENLTEAQLTFSLTVGLVSVASGYVLCLSLLLTPLLNLVFSYTSLHFYSTQVAIVVLAHLLSVMFQEV